MKQGNLLYLMSCSWLHLEGEKNDWHGVQGKTSEVLVTFHFLTCVVAVLTLWKFFRLCGFNLSTFLYVNLSLIRSLFKIYIYMYIFGFAILILKWNQTAHILKLFFYLVFLFWNYTLFIYLLYMFTYATRVRSLDLCIIIIMFEENHSCCYLRNRSEREKTATRKHVRRWLPKFWRN